MFLVAQIVVSVFTFVGLYAGAAHPAGNTARALIVFILPLLILANLVLLVYWLVRRRWFIALLPLVTVLFCIPYIGTIFQLRSQPKGVDAQNGLKVASYNVAMFCRETSGFMAQDILSEMRKQKVDVLCIQEYSEHSGDKLNSNSYKEYFPYMATGREDMIIYSRYPISKSKTILFDDTNNSAMWADIEVSGREFRVFNTHLQTTGINHSLRQAQKAAERGLDFSGNRLLSLIYGNYALGMIVRAGQATLIAQEKRASDKPVILCGDFNDVPYSYVYKTMLGDMVDGFKECGFGFMFTYRGTKHARIDYIFHDKSLHGITYYHGEQTYSDHYPIYMKIAM